jgi:hypothetical protein
MEAEGSQPCPYLGCPRPSLRAQTTWAMVRSYQSGLHVHAEDSIWVHLLTILQLLDVYWIYILALYCLSSMLSMMICSQQCQMAAGHGRVLELENFQKDHWCTIIESVVECTVWHEYDHDGRLVPLPALDDEWLTPAQDAAHHFRQHHRACNRHHDS